MDSGTIVRPVERRDVGALCELDVADGQQGFVAPNGVTFGQAAFEPGSEIFGVWDGDTAVGLLAIVDMAHPDADLDDDDDPDSIYVWRLMVSEDAQGRGHGRAAMLHAIGLAQARGRASVCLSCVNEDGSAIGFYEGLGFRRTGVIAGDEEHVMVRYLNGRAPA